MTTEEKIVAKALELFNSKGIEYVGMRELAAALDTKLGNITYYFPTKEDLIVRVSQDLSALNSTVLKADKSITIESYLNMTRRHFECQYQYRCLFISFVHLMKQYEKSFTRYKKVEEERRKTLLLNLENMVKNKFIQKLAPREMDMLSSSIAFLSRFWISEAAISHYKLGPAKQIQHYLELLANMLLPYCTAKGKEAVRKFSGA